MSDGEPLAAICRTDKKFPHPSVWLDWIRADEGLAIAYAHARDVGADAIAEQALAIIDEEPERVIELDDVGKQSRSRIDSAAVTWARNRADMRLKLLAKWNPGKYGEKQDVNIGNKPGETIKSEVSIVSPELMQELADLAIKTPEGK